MLSTVIRLTGCGFTNTSTVMIDGVTPATNVHLLSSTVLTATMPAHSPGQAMVKVIND